MLFWHPYRNDIVTKHRFSLCKPIFTGNWDKLNVCEIWNIRLLGVSTNLTGDRKFGLRSKEIWVELAALIRTEFRRITACTCFQISFGSGGDSKYAILLHAQMGIEHNRIAAVEALAKMLLATEFREEAKTSNSGRVQY